MFPALVVLYKEVVEILPETIENQILLFKLKLYRNYY